jgi:hypothetical protein
MKCIAAKVRRYDVLHSTLQCCLNDVGLKARGGRVEGFDDGVLTCKRGGEGRDVLEVGSLDRDGGGEVGGGVVIGKGVPGADGHGEVGGDEGVDDGAADVAGGLDGNVVSVTWLSSMLDGEALRGVPYS